MKNFHAPLAKYPIQPKDTALVAIAMRSTNISKRPKLL
jgi:hypothetical protein